MKNFILLFVFLLVITGSHAAEMLKDNEYTNSIGMKLIRIEAGEFMMGFEGTELAKELTLKPGIYPNGDYDEHPRHEVRISRPFYMGVYEVTNLQYELFDPTHVRRRQSGDDEAVVNINWYQAEAFCKWLSDKEGLTYRLPTEAEWEYACRAGTSTPYNIGVFLPEEFSKRSAVVGQTRANAWGLYDMHGSVEEWCYDWYGPYTATRQIDPVGIVDGEFRVTRGGSHSSELYYLRSANRLGTIPEDKHDLIGFRVVIGETPDTEPLPMSPQQPYQIGVKQGIPSDIAEGPNHGEPYFHRPRQFVKVPSTNRGPLFTRHNHFMSIAQCPNGDLLSIWHSCVGEQGRELSVAGSRLRYGSDAWEAASVFWDGPDRNDHGHALWFDGSDTIYHFQGLADQVRNVALVMRTSKDNGVSWSKPRIISGHGSRRMPVESVFETKDGDYVLACDKGGSTIWVSRDKALTWNSPQGRIMGLHQTLLQLNDGRLYCLSRGKNRNGKMPLNISSDMGESWEHSDGPFQPVSWGQRSVLLRLKEGPIFFASFCKDIMITNDAGKQHPVTGLFSAVSTDEGKTWPYKRLITDERGVIVETMNARKMTIDAHNSEFLGYLSVCQTPDKIIHLIGSRQHYAFNYKWLMTRPPAAAAELPNPEARELPIKSFLSNSYRPTKLPTGNNWIWEEQNPDIDTSAVGPLKIQAKSGDGLRLRTTVSHDFADIEWGKGFTAEARVQIIKSQPGGRGLDLEFFNGGVSRYTITITDKGVYWYEGLIVGTEGLDFNEYTPLVEGVDNTDGMHTYRLAVRGDRVVQIYRDDELIGVRRGENRTPREPYLQFGGGPELEALIEYFAYDLGGPLKPAI